MATAVARISQHGAARSNFAARVFQSEGWQTAAPCAQEMIHRMFRWASGKLHFLQPQALGITRLRSHSCHILSFRSRLGVLIPGAGCSLAKSAAKERHTVRLMHFDAIHCLFRNKHRMSGIYMGIWALHDGTSFQRISQRPVHDI